MTPIVSFLQDGHLPQNPDEARKIKKRAARFTILNDVLYKRGFSMPYLKCVDDDEAKYILEEIHEGICGDHAGPRSLISKAIRTGYFLPTMQWTHWSSPRSVRSANDSGMSRDCQQKG